MTAPFVAANNSPLSPSIPVSAWSHPMLRITPWPCLRIRRPTPRDRSIVATTSMSSNWLSLVRNGHWAASPVSVSAPALLTQMSISPQVSKTTSTRPRHCSVSPRSAGMKSEETSNARTRRRPAAGLLAAAVDHHVGPGPRNARATSPADAARRAGHDGPVPDQGPAGGNHRRLGTAGRARPCPRDPVRVEVIPEFLNGETESGVNQVRRDLGEGLEHERAEVEPRVWHLEVFFVDDLVTVAEQIQVDRPGPILLPADSPLTFLDPEQQVGRERRGGRSVCLNDAVEEIVPGRAGRRRVRFRRPSTSG